MIAFDASMTSFNLSIKYTAAPDSILYIHDKLSFINNLQLHLITFDTSMTNFNLEGEIYSFGSLMQLFFFLSHEYNIDICFETVIYELYFLFFFQFAQPLSVLSVIDLCYCIFRV